MLTEIFGYIVIAVSVLSAYRFVYMLIGLLSRARVFEKTEKKLSYGIIIAARNEERVIGKLLDSIAGQDYDGEIKVFVVADNCTDSTARICGEHGATVYERFDPAHMRKGYALEYLFGRIDTDFGIESLDSYIVFDADNLLRPDFISEINKAMAAGADIAVGYRNTKNFSQNAISAAYGIHFMRSSAFLHRPRSVLGLSTHIAGTGWAIKSELLRGGFHCTMLTEDTEFTMKSVVCGRKIEYCEAACFYDEQPYELRTVFRQRVRWIKGRLCCFLAVLPALLRGIFRGKNRISCYDMLLYLFPVGLFSFFCVTLPTAVLTIAGLFSGESLSRFLSENLGGLALSLLVYWGYSVLTGALVVMRERKYISCGGLRLFLFLLVWPWFDLVELPLGIISLFMRVSWKKIKHDRDVSIEEV